MKLICYLRGRQATPKPIVLLESDNLEDLKSRAEEYANTNPSFRHGWKSSDDSQRFQLSIDFDYCLEIQP